MSNVTLERGLAIAATFALLLLVLELVRRKHLQERYALLWLLTALTLLLLAVWKGLLTALSHDVGIHYPPSALFAVAIGLMIVLLLHFSLAVSRLADQNKMLAQRLGLLQARLDRLQERAGAWEASHPYDLPSAASRGAGRTERDQRESIRGAEHSAPVEK